MKLFIAPIHCLTLIGVLAIAACASVPLPPTDALQAADIAVANADKENGTQYAPLEMRTAREKLAAAHDNAKKDDEKNMANARRLADEARADADLAASKARLGKADAVNKEMQKSGDALRQEAQRGSGG